MAPKDRAQPGSVPGLRDSGATLLGMHFYRIPLDDAMSAYRDVGHDKATLNEKLLYAIMAELDKANHQLETLIEKLDKDDKE